MIELIQLPSFKLRSVSNQTEQAFLVKYAAMTYFGFLLKIDLLNLDKRLSSASKRAITRELIFNQLMDQEALVAVQVTIRIANVDKVVLWLRKTIESARASHQMPRRRGSTFSALTQAAMVLRALR
jgi:hypothetical protein